MKQRYQQLHLILWRIKNIKIGNSGSRVLENVKNSDTLVILSKNEIMPTFARPLASFYLPSS